MRSRRPQRPKDPLRGRGERGSAFRCAGCRLDVPVAAPGTAHRNHCPHCLTSLHVDARRPGDRGSPCGARMLPLAITVRGTGEWLLIHRCTACGALRVNRTAGDDNPRRLLHLALRPLSNPSLRPPGLFAPPDG